MAIILCISCSKNNSPTPAPRSASIAGTWDVTADTLTTYTNGIAGTPYVTTLNHSFSMRFASDGTGAILSNGAASNFTYTLSGNTAVINFAAQNSDGYITPAFTETPVIKQLDANNLYLVHDDSSFGKNGEVESVRLTR
ncbi:MAG TPA: hypothetical protein VGN20_28745 [Mucilaginibacter sp.]